MWKIFGRRLDGFSNDDHPSESKPGARDLVQKGKPVDMKRYRAKWDLDYTGSQMPPPDAVKSGKVKPLSKEDRRKLVKWIDLGCPIDKKRGFGWMLDEKRPTLTLTEPREDAKTLSRILIGVHDYYTGIDQKTLQVTASFAIDGVKAGENLASKFRQISRGVWEYRLSKSIPLKKGSIRVSIKDVEGNATSVRRVKQASSLP